MTKTPSHKDFKSPRGLNIYQLAVSLKSEGAAFDIVTRYTPVKIKTTAKTLGMEK